MWRVRKGGDEGESQLPSLSCPDAAIPFRRNEGTDIYWTPFQGPVSVLSNKTESHSHGGAGVGDWDGKPVKPLPRSRP